MIDDLEKVRERVARGALVEALEAALVVWRASRDPGIAAIVAALSDRILVPRKRDGMGIRNPEAWLAAAGAPAADVVGRLAPTLFAMKEMEARKRLESMQGWEPDPRVSRALGEGLRKPPWVGRGTRSAWELVFPLCVRHAEPGLVDTLEMLASEGYRRGTAADMNAWMTAQCGEAARAGRELLARAEPVDEAAREAIVRELAATERGHARGERSEQELLDAIWADPESDEKRIVYGDFLLERSDPRGEILALQWKALRGEATEDDRARTAKLVEKHLRALLGPLLGGIDLATAVIERGFLASATIEIRLKKDVGRLHGHKAWGTLRSVRISKEGQPIEPGFFGAGVFRALREIWTLDAASGRALLSAPPPRLEVLGAEIGAETAALLDALPHLRHLHLTDPDILDGVGLAAFEETLASGRARELERLELGFHESLDAWLPFLLAHDPGCPVLVKAPAGGARPGKAGAWFALRHDAGGRRTLLDIELRGEGNHAAARERNIDHFFRITTAQLARLAPGVLTGLRLVSSPPGAEARATFEAAARRHGIEQLELPDAR